MTVADGIVYDNVCNMNDKCWPNPCQNGGICKQTSTDIHCECDGTGYTGALCHTSLNHRSCMDVSLRNPSLRSDFFYFHVYLCAFTDLLRKKAFFKRA